MIRNVVLVDYENVQHVDLSCLDHSFQVMIFVGAQQKTPQVKGSAEFRQARLRIDFQKIAGNGKNALDFHIAFHLGRVFENAPSTHCFILSRDKGFDPLLRYLNDKGMNCTRVATWAEIVQPIPASPAPQSTLAITPMEARSEAYCSRCEKESTIEHNGGRWCSNCGTFAVPPDPKLTASVRTEREFIRSPVLRLTARERALQKLPICGWCGQHQDMGDGIYDDGEWMCGGCVATHSR